MIPPSHTALPATLWPPPRTESTRSCSRAKAMPRATSDGPAHTTMANGRRSIMPLKTARGVS